VLRNIIGDWGAGLSDGDYACALAALGVLEATGTEQHRASSDPAVLLAALRKELRDGEQTVVWRRAQNVGRATTAVSWRETVHTDAAALLEAWRRYFSEFPHPRQRPRLALKLAWRDRADLFDFNALMSWLARSGVQALVLDDGRGTLARPQWHWPLQVGVPAGAEGAGVLAALREAQRGRSWVAELARCFTVGDARDACDLLILPPGAVAQILEQARTRLRASFAVCLDVAAPDLAQLAERSSALRERLKAAGVVAISRSSTSFSLIDWFVAVLREVSHDMPAHAAVWSTGHERQGVDPLLFGDPAALDRCRILAIAEKQDLVAQAIEAGAAGARVAPQGAPHLGIDAEKMPTFGGPGSAAGPATLQPVPPARAPAARRDLAQELRNRQFMAESVDGVDTVRALTQQAGEIDEARLPRWIQASAWRPDAPEMAARALAPGQWNLLGVFVAPSEVALPGAVFPDQSVDFSRGDVVVSVQVELSGARVATLDATDLKWMFGGELRPGDMRDGGERAGQLLRGPLAKLPVEPEAKKGEAIVGLAATTMILPPAGESTLAFFAVFPAQKSVEGRIAVIHKNRVVQTARLAVGVDAAAAAGSGLDVVADEAIYPRDDDLDERRDYDVAIQLSDVGGKLHLKVHHDGRDIPVQLDALQGPIGRIQRGLENAARSWDYTRPVLQQPILASSLRTLAAAGSELAQHLRKTCGDEIDHWERIHLVPYTKEFLPLEYVYDGPPPRMDATPCPNLLSALDRGGCAGALGSDSAPEPCPNAKDSHFLCPMHFWGFRRVIERNGSLRPADVKPAVAGGGVTPGRKPYGKVGTLLFAASERAFRYETDPTAQAAERAELVKALGVLGGTVTEVSDWDRWRDAAQAKPDMLVLVVHTDVVDETPVLEIGDGKFLGKQEILPPLSGAAGEPQILLLLGCSAADVTENFQPYPECFRDAGVSIVVAPVAPIRGKDAVPIARQIASRLAERLQTSEATAFGELMPLLRRELLRAGHPGVMGLVGFGDGDWLIGGH
jgi:hypothetical protein